MKMHYTVIILTVLCILFFKQYILQQQNVIFTIYTFPNCNLSFCQCRMTSFFPHLLDLNTTDFMHSLISVMHSIVYPAQHWLGAWDPNRHVITNSIYVIFFFSSLCTKKKITNYLLFYLPGTASRMFLTASVMRMLENRHCVTLGVGGGLRWLA